jgi:hypothetical protein
LLDGARDWKRGENLQLQELQDHHIFPRAYLRRHRLTTKTDVNTIVNRTLISDETNGEIRDKAPAAYVDDTDVIPSRARDDRLLPHFLGPAAVRAMHRATDALSDASVAKVYEDFLNAREEAIISEVRRICSV